MIPKDKIKIKQSHNLKILPEYFEAIAKGYKNFEIRKNNRNFQVGDRVILKEFDGNLYTGPEVVANITYITDFAQQEDYIVFGFEKQSVMQTRFIKSPEANANIVGWNRGRYDPKKKKGDSDGR